MNCLRNHRPHIEGPIGCVYCHIEMLHRDADKLIAANAELLEALKDMGVRYGLTELARAAIAKATQGEAK